jgi:hypothetical protein
MHQHGRGAPGTGQTEFGAQGLKRCQGDGPPRIQHQHEHRIEHARRIPKDPREQRAGVARGEKTADTTTAGVRKPRLRHHLGKRVALDNGGSERLLIPVGEAATGHDATVTVLGHATGRGLSMNGSSPSELHSTKNSQLYARDLCLDRAPGARHDIVGRAGAAIRFPRRGVDPLTVVAIASSGRRQADSLR